MLGLLVRRSAYRKIDPCTGGCKIWHCRHSGQTRQQSRQGDMGGGGPNFSRAASALLFGEFRLDRQEVQPGVALETSSLPERPLNDELLLPRISLALDLEPRAEREAVHAHRAADGRQAR